MTIRLLPALCTSDLSEWVRATSLVLAIAQRDHLDRLPYKTAAGLRLEIGGSRLAHRRILTALYRAYRDELKLQDEPRRAP